MFGLSDFREDITSVPKEWFEHLRGETTSFEEAAEWIRNNTGRNDIFLASPCEGQFWITAERAMIVSFKSAPTYHEEWYTRMKQLNMGKDFSDVGSGICTELKENYPKLTLIQLSSIKDRYGAQYYLVDREREDLSNYLIYSNRAYYLYDLRTSEIGTSSIL